MTMSTIFLLLFMWYAGMRPSESLDRCGKIKFDESRGFICWNPFEAFVPKNKYFYVNFKSN